MLTGPLDPVLTGVTMGLQFNPLTAAASATLGAALVGYRKAAVSRRYWAAGVLLAGWAVGDGIRVAAGVGSGTDGLLAGVAWIVTGLALGYALPLVVGAIVGRSVVHGTGWLAAGAVALMLSTGLWALSDRVAVALWTVIS